MTQEPGRQPTAATKPTRVGIFTTLEQADKAVQALHDAGFTREELAIVCKVCDPPKDAPEFRAEPPAGARTGKAVAGGSAIGAILGGLVVVTGVATGGATLLVAGPVLLAGAGTGALAGGFIGAMLTRGGEKEVHDFYDQALDAGKTVVAVEVHGESMKERLALADRILRATGAETVAMREG